MVRSGLTKDNSIDSYNFKLLNLHNIIQRQMFFGSITFGVGNP